MSQIVSLAPAQALADLAQMYGASPEDFETLLPDLTHVWKAVDGEDQVLGVLALRRSASFGGEVMGGVGQVSEREQIAVALLQAALIAQPQLYAYADETYWPISALQEAGLTPFRAYTLFSGSLPKLTAPTPAGFRISALSEVPDLTLRRTAQEGYNDLIGHTLITDDALIANAGGSDDSLGCLVMTNSGEAAGVCRVWRTEDGIALTVPAVLQEYRSQPLMQAMLGWVFEQVRGQGIQQVTIESWGDDEQTLNEIERLGLNRGVTTPIYLSKTSLTAPS